MKYTLVTPGKLWRTLEVLNCREGESDRQLVTDYLRALKLIREDQEVENWPAKWLPRNPSHIRDLGFALANFKAGEKATMPYSPNEPMGKTPGWRTFVFPYGKSELRGHALSELPNDVLLELWRTFEVHKVKDAATMTMVESQVDRALRNALDAMGAEKGFQKE